MLEPDQRRKIIGWVREHDSVIADELTASFTDREHAVDVARGIARDQDMRAFLDKVTVLLDRFAKVEEEQVEVAKRREDRWQAILGPKGLLAALISAAVTLGGVALNAALSHDAPAVSTATTVP